jgi:hypothetical protein
MSRRPICVTVLLEGPRHRRLAGAVEKKSGSRRLVRCCPASDSVGFVPRRRFRDPGCHRRAVARITYLTIQGGQRVYAVAMCGRDGTHK